jgi:hypothetical protein
MRKDRFSTWFLGLFWAPWAAATIYISYQLPSSTTVAFDVFWLLFGWAGTLAIPITFAKWLQSEWIQVDPTKVSWGAAGFLAGGDKSIPISRIREFSFGYYADRHEHESAASLNVYEVLGALGHCPRHTLAYWLAKDDKRFIYERVKAFVAKHSIPLSTVEFGDPPKFPG